MRALAITVAKRVGVLPNLPKKAEDGFSGYATSTRRGMLAPAGTPIATVAELNAEIDAALAMPDLREKPEDAGFDADGGASQKFSALIDSEMTRCANIAEDAGIQPE